MNGIVTDLNQLALHTAAAHAARARAYSLMARAALWLARFDTIAFLGNPGPRFEPHRSMAMRYRSLAKEERQRSREAIAQVFGGAAW